jgi:hypothetical protein
VGSHYLISFICKYEYPFCLVVTEYINVSFWGGFPWAVRDKIKRKKDKKVT